MADLTTVPAQPEEPETDTRADSSEGPHRPFCPSLSRIININGHREEEAEEPQEEAAPEPYITGQSYLTDNHLTICELLKSFLTGIEPEQKALKDITENAKQITEPLAEVLRQAADFGSRFRAFTEEVTERSAQFLEEYRKIQAKLDACDLIPQKKVLDDMTLSGLRALTKDSEMNPAKVLYFCMALDKLSGSIFAGDIIANEDNFLSLDSEKKIVKTVRIDYDGLTADGGITLPERLTLKDRQIYDAITSLYLAGNRLITDAQIFRTVTGTTSKYSQGNIPKEFLERIDAALRKFRGVLTVREGDEDSAEFEVGEPLLFFVRGVMKLRGVKVQRAIRIVETPILWRLAKGRKEIAAVKVERLQAGDYRSAVLRDCLLRRIARIKAGTAPEDRHHRCIRLDYLLKAVNREDLDAYQEDPETHERKRKKKLSGKVKEGRKFFIETVEKFLNAWKGKLLKDFKRYYTEGRTMTGWEVTK